MSQNESEKSLEQKVRSLEKLLELDPEVDFLAVGKAVGKQPSIRAFRFPRTDVFEKDRNRGKELFKTLFSDAERTADNNFKARCYVGALEDAAYVKAIWPEIDKKDSGPVEEQFGSYAVIIRKEKVDAYRDLWNNPCLSVNLVNRSETKKEGEKSLVTLADSNAVNFQSERVKSKLTSIDDAAHRKAVKNIVDRKRRLANQKTVASLPGKTGPERSTAALVEANEVRAGVPRSPGQKGRLNQYVNLRKLGEGGCADVYVGEHRLLGVSHAIKLMAVNAPGSSGQSSYAQKLDDFILEGRFLARLSENNRNIVRIHDFNVANSESDPAFQGSYFMSMDLIEGGDLKNSMAEMSMEDIIKVTITMAEALHSAHYYEQKDDEGRVVKTHEIVHRDVKPHNILISRDGTPLLSDFGLAKRFDKSDRDEDVRGTPDYMAPEQALSPESVDRRADIYGLGAILYEAATGMPRFKDQPGCDSLNGIVVNFANSTKPTAIAKLNPGLGKSESGLDLIAVIEKAMEPSPERRYDSAMELADDLRALLEGRLVTARSNYSLNRRFFNWRRNRGGNKKLAAAALIAAATVSGWLGFNYHKRQSFLQNELRIEREAREKELAEKREREAEAERIRNAAYSGLRETINVANRAYSRLQEISEESLRLSDISPVISATSAGLEELTAVKAAHGLPSDLEDSPGDLKERKVELVSLSDSVKEAERLEKLRIRAYGLADSAFLSLRELSESPSSVSVQSVQEQFNEASAAFDIIEGENIDGLEEQVARIDTARSRLSRLYSHALHVEEVEKIIGPAEAAYSSLDAGSSPSELCSALFDIVGSVERMPDSAYSQERIDDLVDLADDVINRINENEVFSSLNSSGELRAALRFYAGTEDEGGFLSAVKRLKGALRNDARVAARFSQVAQRTSDIRLRLEESVHQENVSRHVNPVLSAYKKLPDSAGSEELGSMLNSIVEKLPLLISHDTDFAESKLEELRLAGYDVLNKWLYFSDKEFGVLASDPDSCTVDKLEDACIFYQDIEGSLDKWAGSDQSNEKVRAMLGAVSDKLGVVKALLNAQKAYVSVEACQVSADSSNRKLVADLTAVHDAGFSQESLEKIVKSYTSESSRVLKEVSDVRSKANTALSRFQDVLSLSPGNKVAVSRVSELSDRLKLLDMKYNAALQRSQISSHVNDYVAALKNKRFDDAIAALERARALDPSPVFAELLRETVKKNLAYRAQLSSDAQEFVFEYQRAVRSLWDEYNSFSFVGDRNNLNSELDALYEGRRAGPGVEEVVGLKEKLEGFPEDLKVVYLARARVLARQAKQDSKSQYEVAVRKLASLESHNRAIRQLDELFFRGKITQESYENTRALLRRQNLEKRGGE